MDRVPFSPPPPPPPTTTASTHPANHEKRRGEDNRLNSSSSSSAVSSPTRDDRKSYHKVSLSNSQSFRVHKRYQNLRIIGTGSYGIVCSAEDTFKKRKVAIKKIANLFSNIYDAKRILREIEVNYFLRHHENVVTLYDVMTDPPGSKCFKDLCK